MFVALWCFTLETVEDLTANTMHKPGCPDLSADASIHVHPAGSSVRRDVAPRACWRCRPGLELRLGV
jgi:hypothetical protein